MSKPKKDSFEKLQAKWYAKIKKAGFDDIERDENDLKIGSSRFYIRHRYVNELWEAKQEYYRLAEHFLNEHEFESELEKVIWEYHTNALSADNIAQTLQKAKVSKLKKSAIKNIIKRLADAMKRKYGITPVETRDH